ncbi:AvrPphF family type III effector [Trinickia acidisoli]|uniref:AvrPphF family type III effector n=1 Tax=Trinickia acidisoli TaxID=2767482 RepID=UPI001A8F51BA|nr:AvrPphF family type III effector [Trinickia acidisoli]
MGRVSKAEAERRTQLLAQRLGGRLTAASGQAIPTPTSRPAAMRPGLAKKPGTTAALSAPSATRTATQKPASANGHIPFTSLEPAVQEALLNRLDPIRKLGLNDDTVLYRATDKSWLKKGGKGGQFTLQGNPNSVASITNHLELKRNPFHGNQKLLSTLPPEIRQRFDTDPSMRYAPTATDANKLKDPTLNVMYGNRATDGAEGYANTGKHVLVKMTLGDLRKAGGGQVFFDDSAAARGSNTVPLIVTLPAGKSVPVEIV